MTVDELCLHHYFTAHLFLLSSLELTCLSKSLLLVIHGRNLRLFVLSAIHYSVPHRAFSSAATTPRASAYDRSVRAPNTQTTAKHLKTPQQLYRLRKIERDNPETQWANPTRIFSTSRDQRHRAHTQLPPRYYSYYAYRPLSTTSFQRSSTLLMI
jgi:hypothetical protein